MTARPVLDTDVRRWRLWRGYATILLVFALLGPMIAGLASGLMMWAIISSLLVPLLVKSATALLSSGMPHEEAWSASQRAFHQNTFWLPLRMLWSTMRVMVKNPFAMFADSAVQMLLVGVGAAITYRRMGRLPLHAMLLLAILLWTVELVILMVIASADVSLLVPQVHALAAQMIAVMLCTGIAERYVPLAAGRRSHPSRHSGFRRGDG